MFELNTLRVYKKKNIMRHKHFLLIFIVIIHRRFACSIPYYSIIQCTLHRIRHTDRVITDN